MTDIVKRLREWAEQEGDSFWARSDANTLSDAADEIERLRVALGHYACPADCNECNGDHTPMWCGAHARAALAKETGHE